MILRYLQEVKNEFFQVKWISIKEIFYISFVAFFVIMVFSFIFLGFDFISIEIIKNVFK
jgi:preprotein translocase subunit SecE